jgi:outer membrane protein OmpA-like peptidoglycan-associated protein
MKMTKRFAWALLPLALAGIGLAQAEGVRVYGAGEVPDANDIADILRGSSPQANKPRMRGISLDPAYQQPAPQPAPVTVQQPVYTPAPVAAPAPAPQVAAAAAPPPAQPAAAPKASAFSLPVKFAFNSADILPEAMPQLDAVAEGVKLVPDARLVVEGHTDASGSDVYNAKLSMRRANAVKQYLVYRHSIEPARLLVEGLGESSPINPANPYAPENRRVQFRTAP